MSENSDVEIWKQKRMLQLMRKALAAKYVEKEKVRKEGEERDVNEILKKVLVGKAWEVLEAARRQYPEPMRKIEEWLVKQVSEGKLKGPISGGELLWFLRYLGLNVKLKTKIVILEHGKLKTLYDKLRGS